MKTSRNTIAKTAVINLLSSTNVALSHAEIQEKMETICDRVTIYRILERLLKEDLIHKIVTTNGVIKYAFCKHSTQYQSNNHIHFNCKKCLNVTCMEVVPQFLLPHNYVVHEVSFVVSGICESCMHKKSD